jgi:hypothetical protein
MAVVYFVALLMIISVTRRLVLPRSPTADSALASLVTGLREVRGKPIVVGVLAITAILNLFLFPYQSMMPILARDVLHIGPELLGVLVSMEGFGALICSITIASWRGLSRHAAVFVTAALLAPTFLFGLALSPWYIMSLPLQLALGAAEAAFGAMQATIVLLSASERARGRAMGILSVCIGTQPCGALLVGLLASQLGVQHALLVGALLAGVMCAYWGFTMLRAPTTPLAEVAPQQP